MNDGKDGTTDGTRSTESKLEGLYLGIEITRRCNLRCPHCFTASGGPAHPGPSFETITKLLADASRAGIRSVAFSGGEPLLRNDLVEIVRVGKRAGIRDFGIVTNGFYANRAKARELVDAGLHIVQVSVDGVDAADHAAVRGCEPRDFYRALRAIRIFLDLGITVDVATILSPRNLRRAPEMAMFCEALGVRGLRYCTFVPVGRAATPEAVEAFGIDPRELDGFIAFMRTLNEQRDARLGIFIDHGIGPWVKSCAFQCAAGKDVAYVSSEGNLYPCPGLIFEPFKIGNVFETPIGDLLSLPLMSSTRTIPRSELQGPCASCANHACSGGCRGAAFARTGDIRGAVSYCIKANAERQRRESVAGAHAP